MPYRSFKRPLRIRDQSYSSGNPHAHLGFSDTRSFVGVIPREQFPRNFLVISLYNNIVITCYYEEVPRNICYEVTRKLLPWNL